MKRALGWLQRLGKNLSFLRGNLLILTLSWMVWYPALRMFEPYDKLYMQDLGATPLIIGGITALSTVVVAFIRIPGGYIADRFGRKKIIVTMTFTVALAYLFYAFAPSWEWIFVGALISNFCLIYQPALMAMRADSVSPERRGIGVALADFLPMLVSIPSPIISGYLVSTMGRVDGMRLVYLAAVGMGVAGAFVRLLLKETLPEKKPGVTRKTSGDSAKTSRGNIWMRQSLFLGFFPTWPCYILFLSLALRGATGFFRFSRWISSV